ncbi:MAG: AMP-binding protein, partial [Hyphomonadaceae bacterium]
MQGLMQDWPMTLDKMLTHAANAHSHREIVARSIEGPIVRTNYGEVWRRAKQVSAALKASGVALGDRVGTLAWNTPRHLEAWYGAMGIGAVLHTVNPRLFPEQIAWIINHAEDRMIFVDTTFVPLLEGIIGELGSVREYVILCDSAHMPKTTLPNAVAYEDYIGGRGLDTPWGGFDECTAAGLCYTSGTTGNPKGVLYSHRSNMLHAFSANQADAFGMRARDNVLMVVPMFHANAWALAFICPMTGCKLVMPGQKLDGPSVYELLESEEITFSAAVPTVWMMLLAHMRENKLKFSTLKKVVIGGSALPEAILRTLEVEHGVEVVHAWGMTEMSPMGTLGTLGPRESALDRESQLRLKLKQGRATFNVEMKSVDDAGKTLPNVGKTPGRRLV